MKTLTLYTTLGCHLCEDAKLVIWPLLAKYGYQLQELDIADSDELMTRYAVRIPVVSRDASGDGLNEGAIDVGIKSPEELNWPFDSEQLEALLSA